MSESSTGSPSGSASPTDMEGNVKWVGSPGRSRGQETATVITLIFAGRLGRCRMTVSRHRAVLGLVTWVGTT